MYIAENLPLFIPSKDEILVKKDNNFFEDRMTSVDSIFIFCVDVHMELDHLSSLHASTWAWSLHPPCGRHGWSLCRYSFALENLKLWYGITEPSVHILKW